MNDHDDAGDQIKGMDSLLYRQRHSAAHIMAEAVLVFVGAADDADFLHDGAVDRFRWGQSARG